MSDENARPWMPDAASDCPVDPSGQRWLESSLCWFADQFGTKVLGRHPVLPTDSFLTDKKYCGSPDQIEAIVGQLCEFMLVSRRRIKLELFDGSAEKREAARRSGSTRAVGHFRVEDGRAIISLDQSESADPALLTAIAVHELCHLRLQGEGRVRGDQPDGERLTDLLTVFFGFGIFAANAAMRFTRSERGFTVISRGQLDDRTLNAARQDGYRRLGYLKSEEFGYALSCYCWLRRELEPSWARYINPGPRVYMERGLTYLGHASAAGELPTGRVLNKTMKIGNATVYVTRGDAGPGPFGVRFPNFPVRRLGDGPGAPRPR